MFYPCVPIARLKSLTETILTVETIIWKPGFRANLEFCKAVFRTGEAENGICASKEFFFPRFFSFKLFPKLPMGEQWGEVIDPSAKSAPANDLYTCIFSQLVVWNTVFFRRCGLFSRVWHTGIYVHPDVRALVRGRSQPPPLRRGRHPPGHSNGKFEKRIVYC